MHGPVVRVGKGHHSRRRLSPKVLRGSRDPICACFLDPWRWWVHVDNVLGTVSSHAHLRHLHVPVRRCPSHWLQLPLVSQCDLLQTVHLTQEFVLLQTLGAYLYLEAIANLIEDFDLLLELLFVKSQAGVLDP